MRVLRLRAQHEPACRERAPCTLDARLEEGLVRGRVRVKVRVRVGLG